MRRFYHCCSSRRPAAVFGSLPVPSKGSEYIGATPGSQRSRASLHKCIGPGQAAICQTIPKCDRFGQVYARALLGQDLNSCTANPVRGIARNSHSGQVLEVHRASIHKGGALVNGRVNVDLGQPGNAAAKVHAFKLGEQHSWPSAGTRCTWLLLSTNSCFQEPRRQNRMGPQSHWLLSRLPTTDKPCEASWFRSSVCLPMKLSLSLYKSRTYQTLSASPRRPPRQERPRLENRRSEFIEFHTRTTKTKGTKGTKPGRQQLVQHAEQEGILQHMLKQSRWYEKDSKPNVCSQAAHKDSEITNQALAGRRVRYLALETLATFMELIPVVSLLVGRSLFA